MKKISLFFATLFCTAATLFAEINDNGDFQTWWFNSYHKSVKDKSTFYLEWEVRFGDNSSKLYLGYAQALYKHDFTSHISIAPGYRQQWAKPSSLRLFRPTYNPFIDVIFKFEPPHLIVYDRSRIQYIISEDRKNLFLYRNRIYVTTKKFFGPLKGQPFISEEVFFVEDIGFEQNRLNFGLSWVLDDDINPKIFYMVRHRKDLVRGWEYQNVFGLMLFTNF